MLQLIVGMPVYPCHHCCNGADNPSNGWFNAEQGTTEHVQLRIHGSPGPSHLRLAHRQLSPCSIDSPTTDGKRYSGPENRPYARARNLCWCGAAASAGILPGKVAQVVGKDGSG